MLFVPFLIINHVTIRYVHAATLVCIQICSIIDTKTISTEPAVKEDFIRTKSEETTGRNGNIFINSVHSP